MKKKNIIYLIIIVFVFILLVKVSTNKSFFKSYYETTSLNQRIRIPLPRFSYYIDEKKSNDDFIVTFKNYNNINISSDIINNYLYSLESCYNENYFYDKEKNISIISYTINKNSFFNNISLRYKKENICEKEFVLEDDWFNKTNSFNFIDAEITQYLVNEDELTSINVEIFENDIQELIANVVNNGIRVENNHNINSDTNNFDTYYIISAYYSEITLKIFIYHNTNIAFVITDENDAKKNSIYEIPNAKQLFIDLYNKY